MRAAVPVIALAITALCAAPMLGIALGQTAPTIVSATLDSVTQVSVTMSTAVTGTTVGSEWGIVGSVRFDGAAIDGATITLTLDEDNALSSTAVVPGTMIEYTGTGSVLAGTEPLATRSTVRLVDSAPPTFTAETTTLTSLTIRFSEPVRGATLPSEWFIDGSNPPMIDSRNVVILSDLETLVLNLDPADTMRDPAATPNVAYWGSGITDARFNRLATVESQTALDKIGPTPLIAEVDRSAPGQFILTFSEPVSTGSGWQISPSLGTITPTSGTSGRIVVLETAQATSDGVDYTVTLPDNIADMADVPNSVDLSAIASFVVSNGVRPTILSAQTMSSTLTVVTLSAPVTGQTVAGDWIVDNNIFDAAKPMARGVASGDVASVAESQAPVTIASDKITLLHNPISTGALPRVTYEPTSDSFLSIGASLLPNTAGVTATDGAGPEIIYATMFSLRTVFVSFSETVADPAGVTIELYTQATGGSPIALSDGAISRVGANADITFSINRVHPAPGTYYLDLTGITDNSQALNAISTERHPVVHDNTAPTETATSFLATRVISIAFDDAIFSSRASFQVSAPDGTLQPDDDNDDRDPIAVSDVSYDAATGAFLITLVNPAVSGVTYTITPSNIINLASLRYSLTTPPPSALYTPIFVSNAMDSRTIEIEFREGIAGDVAAGQWELTVADPDDGGAITSRPVIGVSADGRSTATEATLPPTRIVQLRLGSPFPLDLEPMVTYTPPASGGLTDGGIPLPVREWSAPVLNLRSPDFGAEFTAARTITLTSTEPLDAETVTPENFPVTIPDGPDTGTERDPVALEAADYAADTKTVALTLAADATDGVTYRITPSSLVATFNGVPYDGGSESVRHSDTYAPTFMPEFTQVRTIALAFTEPLAATTVTDTTFTVTDSEGNTVALATRDDDAVPPVAPVSYTTGSTTVTLTLAADATHGVTYTITPAESLRDTNNIPYAAGGVPAAYIVQQPTIILATLDSVTQVSLTMSMAVTGTPPGSEWGIVDGVRFDDATIAGTTITLTLDDANALSSTAVAAGTRIEYTGSGSVISGPVQLASGSRADLIDRAPPTISSARTTSSTTATVTLSEPVTGAMATADWSLVDAAPDPDVTAAISSVSASGATVTITYAEIPDTSFAPTLTYTASATPLTDTSPAANALASTVAPHVSVADGAPPTFVAETASTASVTIRFSEQVSGATLASDWRINDNPPASISNTLLDDDTMLTLALSSVNELADGAATPSIDYTGSAIADDVPNTLAMVDSQTAIDKVRPTGVSAAFMDSLTIIVTFSEPVTVGSTWLISPLGLGAITPTSGTPESTVILGVTNEAPDGGEYTITIPDDIDDLAVVANDIDVSTTPSLVATYTVPPSLSSARTTSTTLTVVTLTKAVTGQTVAGDWVIDVDTTDGAEMRATGVASGEVTTVAASTSPVSISSDKLTLLHGTVAPDATPTVTYEPESTSMLLTLDSPLAEDMTGVVAADATPPGLTAAEFTGARTIELTFSESLTTFTTTPANFAVTVPDGPDAGNAPDAVALATRNDLASPPVVPVAYTAGSTTVTLTLAADATDGVTYTITPSTSLTDANSVPSDGSGISVVHDDTYAPEIIGVEFTEARTIELTFTEPLALTTATTANFAVTTPDVLTDTDTDPEPVVLDSIDYTSGSTTLTIVLTDDAFDDVEYTIAPLAALTDTNGNPYDADADAQRITYDDTVPPTFTAEFTAARTLVLTFTEQLAVDSVTAANIAVTVPDGPDAGSAPDAVALATRDDSASPPVVPVAYTAGSTTVTLTLAADATDGVTYTITPSRFLTDVNALSYRAGGVDVMHDDTYAPEFPDADFTGPRTIELTFSEPLAASTVTAANIAVTVPDGPDAGSAPDAVALATRDDSASPPVVPVAYTAGSTTVTLTLAADATDGVVHTVTPSGSVTDTSSLPYGGPAQQATYYSTPLTIASAQTRTSTLIVVTLSRAPTEGQTTAADWVITPPGGTAIRPTGLASGDTGTVGESGASVFIDSDKITLLHEPIRSGTAITDSVRTDVTPQVTYEPTSSLRLSATGFLLAADATGVTATDGAGPEIIRLNFSGFDGFIIQFTEAINTNVIGDMTRFRVYSAPEGGTLYTTTTGANSIFQDTSLLSRQGKPSGAPLDPNTDDEPIPLNVAVYTEVTGVSDTLGNAYSAGRHLSARDTTDPILQSGYPAFVGTRMIALVFDDPLAGYPLVRSAFSVTAPDNTLKPNDADTDRDVIPLDELTPISHYPTSRTFQLNLGVPATDGIAYTVRAEGSSIVNLGGRPLNTFPTSFSPATYTPLFAAEVTDSRTIRIEFRAGIAGAVAATQWMVVDSDGIPRIVRSVSSDAATFGLTATLPAARTIDLRLSPPLSAGSAPTVTYTAPGPGGLTEGPSASALSAGEWTVTAADVTSPTFTAEFTAARTLVLMFTEQLAVDSVTAANIAVTVPDGPDDGTERDPVELESIDYDPDSTTVTLTLPADATDGVTYGIEPTASLTDTNGVQYDSGRIDVLHDDTYAPSLMSVEFTGARTIELTFTEPLTASTVTAANIAVTVPDGPDDGSDPDAVALATRNDLANPPVMPVAYTAGSTTVTLTLAADATDGVTYTITPSTSLTDTNAVPSDGGGVDMVHDDTYAPEIIGVEFTGARTIELTFTEPLALTTATTANFAVTTPDVLTDTDTDPEPVVLDSIDYTSGSTTLTIVLTDDAFDDVEYTIAPLAALTDTNGNPYDADADAQRITYDDTVPPTFTAEFTAARTLVLTFTEQLAVDSVTAANIAVTIPDGPDDGSDPDAVELVMAAYTEGSTTVTLTLAADATDGVTYTITPSRFLTDVNALSYRAGGIDVMHDDTYAPEFPDAEFTGARTIELTFSEPLAASTVTAANIAVTVPDGPDAGSAPDAVALATRDDSANPPVLPVAYTAGSTTVTLTLAADAPSGVVHTITPSASVTDTSSLPYGGPAQQAAYDPTPLTIASAQTRTSTLIVVTLSRAATGGQTTAADWAITPPGGTAIRPTGIASGDTGTVGESGASVFIDSDKITLLHEPIRSGTWPTAPVRTDVTPQVTYEPTSSLRLSATGFLLAADATGVTATDGAGPEIISLHSSSFDTFQIIFSEAIAETTAVFEAHDMPTDGTLLSISRGSHVRSSGNTILTGTWGTSTGDDLAFAETYPFPNLGTIYLDLTGVTDDTTAANAISAVRHLALLSFTTPSFSSAQFASSTVISIAYAEVIEAFRLDPSRFEVSAPDNTLKPDDEDAARDIIPLDADTPITYDERAMAILVTLANPATDGVEYTVTVAGNTVFSLAGQPNSFASVSYGITYLPLFTAETVDATTIEVEFRLGITGNIATGQWTVTDSDTARTAKTVSAVSADAATFGPTATLSSRTAQLRLSSPLIPGSTPAVVYVSPGSGALLYSGSTLPASEWMSTAADVISPTFTAGFAAARALVLPFSEPLIADTVTAANIAVTIPDGPDDGTERDPVELESVEYDPASTTVTLTLPADATDGVTYGIEPTASLTDTNGVQYDSGRIDVLHDDTYAPSIMRSEFRGERTILLIFSEPLADNTVTAANIAVTIPDGPDAGTARDPVELESVDYPVGGTAVTLTLEADAIDDTTYTIEPTASLTDTNNVQYAAGGVGLPYDDVYAPEFMGVEFTGEQTLVLSFGEPLATFTVIAANFAVTVPDGPDPGTARDVIALAARDDSASPPITPVSYTEGSTTVTLMLAEAAVDGVTYTITPSTSLTDSNGVPYGAGGLTTQHDDVYAPTFTAETTSLGSVTVRFSEPVDGATLPSEWVVGSSAPATLNSEPSVTLNGDTELILGLASGSRLADSAVTPAVEYSGTVIADAQGNTLPVDSLTAVDRIPPSAVSAAFAGPSGIRVVFSEQLATATVTDTAFAVDVLDGPDAGSEHDAVALAARDDTASPPVAPVSHTAGSSTVTLTLAAAAADRELHRITPSVSITDAAGVPSAPNAVAATYYATPPAFTVATRSATSTLVTFTGALGGTLDLDDWIVTDDNDFDPTTSETRAISRITLGSATGAQMATPRVALSIPGGSTETTLVITHEPLSSTASTPAVAYTPGALIASRSAVASDTLEAVDAAPPALASASFTAANTIEIEFSEPLDASSLPSTYTIRTLGVNEPATVALSRSSPPAYSIDSGVPTLVITLAASALRDVTHSVSIPTSVTDATLLPNAYPGYAVPVRYIGPPGLNVEASATERGIELVFSNALSADFATTSSFTVSRVTGPATTVPVSVSVEHVAGTNRAFLAFSSSTANDGESFVVTALARDALGMAFSGDIRVTYDAAPPTFTATASHANEMILTMSEPLDPAIAFGSLLDPAKWSVEGSSGVTTARVVRNVAGDTLIVLDHGISYVTEALVTYTPSLGSTSVADVRDRVGKPMAAQSVRSSDTIGPFFQSARFVDSDTMSVTFTETIAPPTARSFFFLHTTPTGATAGIIGSSPTLDSSATTVTFDLLTLDLGTRVTVSEGSTYYLRITGITDASSNANLYFNPTHRPAVTYDPTLPTASASFQGDSSIIVRFSKAIDTDTVSASAFAVERTANSVSSPVAINSVEHEDGSPTVILRFTSLATSLAHTVRVTGVADTNGNAYAGGDLPVTPDVMPPSFTARTAPAQEIEVTFDEEVLAVSGATALASHWTVDLTPGNAADTASDVVPISVSGTLPGRTLTLTLPPATTVASSALPSVTYTAQTPAYADAGGYALPTGTGATATDGIPPNVTLDVAVADDSPDPPGRVRPGTQILLTLMADEPISFPLIDDAQFYTLPGQNTVSTRIYGGDVIAAPTYFTRLVPQGVDPPGPIHFEVTLRDVAGNPTTITRDDDPDGLLSLVTPRITFTATTVSPTLTLVTLDSQPDPDITTSTDLIESYWLVEETASTGPTSTLDDDRRVTSARVRSTDPTFVIELVHEEILGELMPLVTFARTGETSLLSISGIAPADQTVRSLPPMLFAAQTQSLTTTLITFTGTIGGLIEVTDWSVTDDDDSDSLTDEDRLISRITPGLADGAQAATPGAPVTLGTTSTHMTLLITHAPLSSTASTPIVSHMGGDFTAGGTVVYSSTQEASDGLPPEILGAVFLSPSEIRMTFGETVANPSPEIFELYDAATGGDLAVTSTGLPRLDDSGTIVSFDLVTTPIIDQTYYIDLNGITDASPALNAYAGDTRLPVEFDGTPPMATALSVTVHEGTPSTGTAKTGQDATFANAGDTIRIDMTLDEDTSSVPEITIPGIANAADMVRIEAGNDSMWRYDLAVSGSTPETLALSFSVSVADTEITPNEGTITESTGHVGTLDVPRPTIDVTAPTIVSTGFTSPTMLVVTLSEPLARPASTIEGYTYLVTAPDNTQSFDDDTDDDVIVLAMANLAVTPPVRPVVYSAGPPTTITLTLATDATEGVTYTARLPAELTDRAGNAFSVSAEDAAYDTPGATALTFTVLSEGSPKSGSYSSWAGIGDVIRIDLTLSTTVVSPPLITLVARDTDGVAMSDAGDGNALTWRHDYTVLDSHGGATESAPFTFLIMASGIVGTTEMISASTGLVDGVTLSLPFVDTQRPALDTGNSLYTTTGFTRGTQEVREPTTAGVGDTLLISLDATEKLVTAELENIRNPNDGITPARADVVFFPDTPSRTTATTAVETLAPSHVYTYSRTIAAGDSEGPVTFSITIRDRAGNEAASPITHLDLATIAARNPGFGYRAAVDSVIPSLVSARTTSTATLDVTVSEALSSSATTAASEWSVAEGLRAPTVSDATISRNTITLTYADVDDTSFAPTVLYAGSGLVDEGRNAVVADTMTPVRLTAADAQAPVALLATFVSPTEVHVAFSEDVTLPRQNPAAGWSIEPRLPINRITQPSPSFVGLVLGAPATHGTHYTISVGDGVTDMAVAPNAVDPDATVQETYMDAAAYTAMTFRSMAQEFIRIQFAADVTGETVAGEWFVGVRADGTGGTATQFLATACDPSGVPAQVSSVDLGGVCPSSPESQARTFYLDYDAPDSGATPRVAYRAPVGDGATPIVMAADAEIGAPDGAVTASDGLPPLFEAATATSRSVTVTFDEDVAGSPDASRWYHYDSSTVPPTQAELDAAVSAGTGFASATFDGRALTLMLPESYAPTSGWGSGDTAAVPGAIGYRIPLGQASDIADIAPAANSLVTGTAAGPVADGAPPEIDTITAMVVEDPDGDGTFAPKPGVNARIAGTSDAVSLTITLSEASSSASPPVLSAFGQSITMTLSNGDRTATGAVAVSAASRDGPFEFAITVSDVITPPNTSTITQDDADTGILVDVAIPMIDAIFQLSPDTVQFNFSEPVVGSGGVLVDPAPGAGSLIPILLHAGGTAGTASIALDARAYTFTISADLADRAGNAFVPQDVTVDADGTFVSDVLVAPASPHASEDGLVVTAPGDSLLLILDNVGSDGIIRPRLTVGIQDRITMTIEAGTKVESFGPGAGKFMRLETTDRPSSARLVDSMADSAPEYVGADAGEPADAAAAQAIRSLEPAILAVVGKADSTSPILFSANDVSLRLHRTATSEHTFYVDGAGLERVHSIASCASAGHEAASATSPPSLGGATDAADADECLVTDGIDTVIWTNHLTLFGASAQRVFVGSSSSCDDCTPPTLGVDSTGARRVTDGFSYNGDSTDAEYYYTPMPLITVVTGEENVAQLTVFEDSGPQNVRHVGLGFGLSHGQHFAESNAAIRVDMPPGGEPVVSVDDPAGAIDVDSLRVETGLSQCQHGSESICRTVTIYHTFREPLEFSVVSTIVWDDRRNAWQNFFNHGIHIIGESLNPERGIPVNDGELTLYPLISSNLDEDGDGVYDYDVRHVTYMLDSTNRVYRLSQDGEYVPLRNLSLIYHAPPEDPLHGSSPYLPHGPGRGTAGFSEALEEEGRIAAESMARPSPAPPEDSREPVSSEPEDRDVYLQRLHKRIAQEINLAELDASALYPALSAPESTP